MVKDKLLFVECKTQVYDITDVDKFFEVTRHTGGLSAKPIFFTYEEIRLDAKEKCENNNIPCYCMKKEVLANEVSNERSRNKIEDYLSEVNAR